MAEKEIRKAKTKYVNANQNNEIKYQRNEIHNYLKICTNNVHSS